MTVPLTSVSKRLALCVMALGLLATAWALLRPVPVRAIDCVVTFPLRPAGTVEAILVAGQAHAADWLAVRYLDGGSVQFFWDSTGRGGPAAAPISLPAGRRVAMHIDAPSLYQRFERPLLEREPDDQLDVTVDGRAILSGAVAFRRSASIDRHLGTDSGLALRCEARERFGGTIDAKPPKRIHIGFGKLPRALAWTLTNSAGIWLTLGWALFTLADWRAGRRDPKSALGPDARVLSGIGLAAVLATFYIGSAGQPFDLREDLNGYPEGYAMMTHAFARGQLSLLQTPSPALLALPNPYDSRQNEGLRLHDAILYRGKYYFYFSPVPTVLMNLPVLWATDTDVPQALAVTLWTAAGTLLMLGALLRFKRVWHPDLPLWALGALGANVAFAAPVLYLVGRPTMYEQPIAAAYAFLGLGLFALAGACGRCRRGFSWALVSACGFALAAACRPNIALACPGLGLVWLMLARDGRGFESDQETRLTEGNEGNQEGRSSGPREIATSKTSHRTGGWNIKLRVALLCLPFVAVGFGLGYLNWKRFDAPLDFGWRWQLWGRPELASKATNFSLRNVPPNAQQYLYGPPRFSSAFPYVEANARKVYFRSPYTIGAEPLVGIAWALPLETLALGLWILRLRRRRLADLASQEPWIGALLVSGAGVMFFNHLYSAFAMRYMPDFLPFLEVAGGLAFMGWVGRVRRGPARTVLVTAAIAVSVVVALASVGMSLKAGDLGFAWRNPELYERIAAYFPKL